MAEIKDFKKPDDNSRTPRASMTAPYNDLDASIVVADAIYHKGGGVAGQDRIALWLNYSTTQSGAFKNRLLASRHFGLVEMNEGKFHVTELAKKILAPIMPEHALEAKVEAFLAIPLFNNVFEKFRGSQLPREEGLINLFKTTYRISPERADKAVKIFLNSAEQAGFFDETNDRSRMLMPDVSKANSVTTSSEKSEIVFPPEQEKPASEKPRSSGGDGSIIHGAISGLLRDLPPPGAWNSQKKQSFMAAFKAAMDWIYPDEDTLRK